MTASYGAQRERVKPDVGPWLPLFERYEIATLPHDTVVKGLLRAGLDVDSPEVRAALARSGAPAHFQRVDEGTELAIVVPGDPPRERLWLHLVLFAATLLTTLASGALLAGTDPFHTRVGSIGGVLLPYPTRLEWGRLAVGSTFAFPFMGVLLAHEMGHWVAARRHRIRATLPFFMPVPPYLSIIGTVGAFIRMRGATIRRSHLFDVGAAGPVASLLASVPLLALGLAWSHPVPGRAALSTPFVIDFAGQPVWLGNSLLTQGIAVVFAPGAPGTDPLLLHPLAFAGWLGLFVTALNLMPLGQLDGGHVLYALHGGAQRRAARLFLLGLLPLGLLWWGWWVWALLVAALHRGRRGGARVVLPEDPVRGARRALGWLLVLVFFLSFVPVPLHL